MKRILIFLALSLAAYVSFSQSPIYGRLRVISGTYDNYFQNGTDTFKLGWRNDRFQLKYNTNKRFIDFIKSDSTVKIYNKLILESPNDTMLSVRGTVRVSENVILGDSNNYNGLNIVPIGDGIVQWVIENYNDSTLYLAARYYPGETTSDFDVITQGDILIFHDTLNNEYIGKVVRLIPAQLGKWGVISPLRATISIEDASTLVGSIEKEIYKGTLDSIIGNHSIVIGNNNIIDNEQVFIIGDSVTTSQNNTIYVNDDIKIGEITLLPTITITDWTQGSDYLYDMYSNPDIMHFGDAALNYWQVGDVLIMCGMNEGVSDSIPRDVFRVDSIVSIGADSLYHYVTALYGSIQDAYENSDGGAYKGTFVEGCTHNAINIGSDNTIANKGSHIIGLNNFNTEADSTLFVNNITIKSSLKADDANVQNLLTTENIVVGDSLLFSGSNISFDTTKIFHNITINSDGWLTVYIYLSGDCHQYFHQYDSIIVHDTITANEYTMQIFQSWYNGTLTALEMYPISPAVPQGFTYGWLELNDEVVDSTVTNKIVIDGVFEMADSVLVVNSSERTSIFNGKVIMRNPTDTLLSVRGGGMNVIDGSVLFSGATGTTPASGAGTRLMWIPSKAAFRAGEVDGTQWDADSIEFYSFAVGYNTKATKEGAFAVGSTSSATGIYSYAFGFYNTASGSYSIANGNFSTASGHNSYSNGYNILASGDYSFASGVQTVANSHNLSVFGQFNDTTISTSEIAWVSTDPLFQIGNGTEESKRNDAFRILKNGKTFIGDSSNTTDAILIVDPTDSTSTFIGTVSVEKSLQVGNDATAASAANVGAIRYRSDANNSYCEMVMQTGASTYAWVVIKQNTW